MRNDKLQRMKEYIENEKKYWKKYYVSDGSTEASYSMDTWLGEFEELLKRERENETLGKN
jgi:hypothetical protein